MKKLVVFDLDGTLVDSIADLGIAVNIALKEYNLPLNPMSDYYTFVGNGMEDLVRRSMRDKGGDDELYLKVRKVFDAYYHAHSNDNTKAYEGVSELLNELKLKGIRTAVLTNKAHEYVGDILKKCFPDFTFDLYYGQRQGIERKPHPQSFELLLAELNISKEDCLYIGDSEVDVKTAFNAEVDLVAVNWGYRSEETLKNTGAEIIVSTPKEILNYV
ncbi:MAG: HAD-IIIA family hydrolase [Ruminococcaceae bacterium]|nr:HAD-IIIA family hydrolase [Oscillospiraceae bacterium]